MSVDKFLGFILSLVTRMTHYLQKQDFMKFWADWY